MAGFPTVRSGSKRGEVAKRPKPGIPLDPNVVEKLIIQSSGNLSMVADAIGSCRGVVRNVVDRHPHLQEVLKQCRERQLDQLEQTVFDRALETNDTCLQIFLLKTQGKHRGYDQSEAQHAAKDIATAAFDFIISKSGQPRITNQ
jgi:hypothetical protein